MDLCLRVIFCIWTEILPALEGGHNLCRALYFHEPYPNFTIAWFAHWWRRANGLYSVNNRNTTAIHPGYENFWFSHCYRFEYKLETEIIDSSYLILETRRHVLSFPKVWDESQRQEMEPLWSEYRKRMPSDRPYHWYQVWITLPYTQWQGRVPVPWDTKNTHLYTKLDHHHITNTHYLLRSEGILLIHNYTVYLHAPH